MRTTKYSFIVISLLVLSSMILTACGPKVVTGTLTMLDWSGYELPEFWSDFAATYPQVKVEFSFMSESADSYAKMKSGFQADLVHPCSNFWKIMVDEGMVQPLDTSKISNWKNVNPALAAQGQFNGKQYWAPWDWGFESILVRKDLVQNVPTSWADLWKPEYKGHIALYDSGETAHVITALALGIQDPWSTTPAQDEQIKQKLLELMPNVLTVWSSQTELEQMIASGDVWVAASAWNASYVNMLDQGLDVVYIDPAEGRGGYLCGFAIPTTSKNTKLALAMIDAYLAPSSQAYLANEYGYGIVNTATIPLVDPNTVKLLSLEDQNIISRTVFYKYLTPEQRDAWTSVWSEVKTSK
jgi:putative spermidine/putrescine transport system substrate-binding protein/spermidine/putrescine transport system substrate-binding protein